MPTVSIITPTYNRPDLLGEAIQSVLAQTFEDWEMLIVEDGSNGSARGVVAGFNDPRLHYIYQVHAGRSATRNRGLLSASGEYIAFLDDDDLYHPDKLTKELAFLENNSEVEIVGSGYRSIDKQGKVFEINQHWETKPEINFTTCLSSCPIATCSVLIRRPALDQMDHWFDPAFDLNEDMDFFLRLFLSGARFEWLNDTLSDYRFIHDRHSRNIFEIRNFSHQVLEKILKINNLSSERTDMIKSTMLEFDIFYAWVSYEKKLVKTAQKLLLLAVIQEPSLLTDNSNFLVNGMVTFAQNNTYCDNPRNYIDYVLSNLPTSLQFLKQQKQNIIHKVQSK